MSKQPKLVSLFPYQIKNVNSFYERDHPVNLHPESFQYKKYWGDFMRKCIEGKWVNDNGTWVFMYPKLFFYCNYTKIHTGEDREYKSPDLRDNEWILGSYFMCIDGFSGFVEDEEYTCHFLVEKLEESLKDGEKSKKKIRDREIAKIPKSCLKKDGSYKKFIDPWEYLTRFYLLELNHNKPLGAALYENYRAHGCILTARGIGKSLFTFMGDFLHEWLFNGIKKYEDLRKVNDKLLFGMGAADATAINKSIGNVASFYNRMPGQYRYSDQKKPKYMGPLFKRVQGNWSNKGDEVKHIVKSKNGRNYIDSSTLYINILTPDNTTIGAGDRFRRIYIEEVGFVENALLVHSTNKDSLISEGIPVGSAVFTGTGGSMVKVKDVYKMFNSVASYRIFGIPNYWDNIKKKIGLFMPVHYAIREFKDSNGNTRLSEAHEELLAQREINLMEMDSVSYDSDISFNPMEPKEILKSNSGSMLPKREAQDQLSRLDAYDIWKLRAQIGSLEFDKTSENGVRWNKDIEGKLRPILDLKNDDTPGFSKEGAVILYEYPAEYIPEGLYYIVYDPAKKSGDGESYHSILVYKNFFFGGQKTLYDTIVAEMLCRKGTLNENYIEVIKLAKFFNAKIFPEINVAGFVEWCKTEKYWDLLESDAYEIEQEINPDAKRSYYKVGCDMSSKRKKRYAMQKLRDWLLDIKEKDAVTNLPTVRTIDWLFSKRALEEIASYEGGDGENYDHLSSLLVLMILIEKIHKGDKPNLNEEEKEAEDNFLNFDAPQPPRTTTAKFLTY
jgi:hypothetical protein